MGIEFKTDARKALKVTSWIVVPLLVMWFAFAGEVGDSKWSARRAADLSRAKRLGMALIAYANAHHQRLPATSDQMTLSKELNPYGGRVEDWTLVSVDDDRFQFSRWLAGKSLASLTHPKTQVLVYDEWPDSAGQRLVCFADGHVRRVSEEAWRSLLTQRSAASLKRAGKAGRQPR